MTEKESFIVGWEAGYSDGGEHDCRMFEPTAERAWESYEALRQRRQVTRAKKCKECETPLLPYSPHNTSTWRTDDFCSARCKRKYKG